MTTNNLNYNPNYISNKPQSKLQNFFQQRPLLLLLLFVGFITLIIAILVIIFSPPRQDPEKAPYITFENETVISNQLPSNINDEILFNLRLILLNSDEIASLPQKNPNGENHIVSFDTGSFRTSTVANSSDTKIYSINCHLSDGRQYTLYIYFDSTYHNEYAIAALDRTDQSGKDYIIALTDYTNAYYAAIGTDKLSELENSSDTVDYITGYPVQPLPSAATNWINTLNLSNPEIIYSALPSLY